MSHWTQLPVCSVDCETTGVSPFDDRIVEIAIATVAPDGTVIDGWSRIIDPKIEIPEGAAAVHGITTERARAEGGDAAEVLGLVANALLDHQADHAGAAAVVIFNCRFDWPLLLVEAERHGVDIPCIAGLLDPMLIDRLLDKYRKGGRKLITVAGHYDVPLDEADAHGALADAIAAGRVMHKIAAAYPQLATRSLASMWLRQVRGHEEDRLRFIDYMRTQVDPQFDTPAGWPIPVAVAS